MGLTLNLLKTTIVAPPSNANIWQMAFNSAFKGLSQIGIATIFAYTHTDTQTNYVTIFLNENLKT